MLSLIRLPRHGRQLLPSVAAPDGAYLGGEVGGGEGIPLCPVGTGQWQARLPGPGGRPLEAVDFSPDSRRVAVAVPDTAIRIYDVTTGKEQWQRLPRGWLAVEASVQSPRPKSLAAHHMSGKSAVVWVFENGEVRLGSTTQTTRTASPGARTADYWPSAARITLSTSGMCSPGPSGRS